MTGSVEQLWNFSLRLYGIAEVERACLNLQGRSNWDVNFLLFCCWTGVTFGVLPDNIMSTAINYSNQWNGQVVHPLRNVRAWMKGRDWITVADDHNALRDQIKIIELEAERLQQSVLEHLTDDLSPAIFDPELMLDACMGHLEWYIQRTVMTVDRETLDDLAIILHAVIQEISLEMILLKLESRII